MGSATLVTLEPGEIRKERERLLVVLGGTAEEARLRAEAGLLSEEEYLALRRLDELTWLLGGHEA